jgi:Asp-tRNA(Asn)/Glu-tRNA(Gln) amidotransferase C subunit
MQKAELDKLLKLTAIELEPEQVPVFLDYFSSMKKMFDEFYEFPLPVDNPSVFSSHLS